MPALLSSLVLLAQQLPHKFVTQLSIVTSILLAASGKNK